MYAIITPLHEEIKQLLPYLEIDITVHLHPGRIWHGRIGAQEIIFARAGFGAHAMRDTARACFHMFRPTDALLLGFGGATTAELHQGDLVLATEIFEQSSQKIFTAPTETVSSGTTVASLAGMAAHPGRIVTTDTMITTPHEKTFLGTQCQSLAVEMEGAAFAAEAAAAGIPWLVARTIYDPMDIALPENFIPFADDGVVSPWRVACALARNPRILLRLPQMYFAATKARQMLTTFAKAWINQH